MTLIARQQSAGGHEPVFRSHSRACAALESGGPWKASRRDETSFFATASKKPVDLAVWATKPGQGSLDGTLSGGVEGGHVSHVSRPRAADEGGHVSHMSTWPT